MKVKDLTKKDWGKEAEILNSKLFPEHNGKVCNINYTFRNTNGYFAAVTLDLGTLKILLSLPEDTEIEFVEE